MRESLRETLEELRQAITEAINKLSAVKLRNDKRRHSTASTTASSVTGLEVKEEFSQPREIPEGHHPITSRKASTGQKRGNRMMMIEDLRLVHRGQDTPVDTKTEVRPITAGELFYVNVHD
ncbi:hypothetical protein FOL47_010862 [Perkinsus chesapeaki]|uniref:Uncharacterized protein n=1 Tax=Perkinsus chesapeaki TaxID=330153 RepID=A0A7J6L1T7_PERCH|nr:hypothetical protein FOL47_010862 [Perkinsus chesapeaki]